MRTTLEIDDESLVEWRPINSTFLFNSKSPPSAWSPEDYRVGILIQMGIYDLIDMHKGDHSASELRHLRLKRSDGADLLITRSHFEDLGLWINILPANMDKKTRELLAVSPDSYEALFGPDGKHAARREHFRPYGGGITVWPEPSDAGGGGKRKFCDIAMYADANTPHHAWYRFEFAMSDPEVAFQARTGIGLPAQFGNRAIVAPADSENGYELPSLLVEGYGIPPGGDGQDPPPLPGPR